MPSPAEPQTISTGLIPLTARALDQLDAQVADAEKRSTTNLSFAASSNSKQIASTTTPDMPNASNKMIRSHKSKANLESEDSKASSTSASHNKLSSHPTNSSHHPQDPSAPVPLMTDYIVDGTIYRSPDTLDTLITIASTPTKGLAVFALRDLPPHTLLLSERPLVALNDDGARIDPLDGLVNALSPPLKRAYRSLHAGTTKTGPRESLNRRVLYSNGFAIQRTTTAVFEVASRINHSCVPNARFRWDEEAGRMDYYTLRKVLEGEEVCIDYGHTKGRLLKYYGFECACGGCTDWGSVTSSGAISEGVADGDVRLVQADGLWRPVEVADIAAAVKEKSTATVSSTKVEEMGGEKEHLLPKGTETG
ncbi:hypothetical protein N0V93_007924 [Gnomoniopsis smithogilvyi]|uniref:SET domain-containing protein n=1 Tax=Gnomoniopsis smithogilvyi TaxID=1191159 RepID=A0A9W8YKR7_9PEZI|nr:hypothetical protein N0V93_007924 [Gnomoniopsis smithogilvyi]